MAAANTFYDEARRLLSEAQGRLEVGRVAQAPIWLSLVRAEIAVDLNRLDDARRLYGEAQRLATSSNDLATQADALLGQAEIALRQGTPDALNAAVALYNQARDLCKATENRVGEVVANVGLGRVLLARELWEEGVEAAEEMVPRLRELEQRGALVLALLAIGQGRRGRQELEVAEAAFAEARELAHDIEHPMLESQATEGLANIALDRDDFARALATFDAAIQDVNAVVGRLSDASERSSYLEGEVDLFAEAAYAAVRAGQQDHATATVRGYVAATGKPAKEALADALKTFESALNQRAKETEDKAEAERFKEQARRMGDLRKLAR